MKTHNYENKSSSQKGMSAFSVGIDNEPDVKEQTTVDAKQDNLENTSITDQHVNKINNSSLTNQHQIRCVYCKLGHDIDDCPDYKKLDMKAKKSFIFSKRLCFSCYKSVSSSHTSKTCMNKRTCSICKETHPTSLHPSTGTAETIPETMVSVATGYDVKTVDTVNVGKKVSKVISLCILPVSIRHGLDPENVMTVYAMLDNCSEGTFLTEEVAEVLFTPSTSMDEKDAHKLLQSINPTNIGLRTLNGWSSHNSCSAEGLQVSSVHNFDGVESPYFNLPTSYTRELLPIERVNIPTVEKIKHWEYLQPILHEIPQFDCEVPIGLLIGGDASKLIEPMKVIPSSDSGPYAFQTALGWCISGSLHVECAENSNTIICNRIAVQDISTGELADHHIVVEENFQDNKLHDSLLRMYQTEFVENQKESKALSVEDKRFLHTMEQHAQKEGKHHKLPLPLRNEITNLPNNRVMAVRRMQPLKKKLERDPHYHREYSKFMNNLLEKGIARECSNNGNEDDVSWFLPHHGVVKPNKPGKVRPVFDCAAKFLDRSLNKELLSGPDLTNLLLGVILRFRLEEVPCMADIESMYYQVLVSDKQRSLLKFLWWPKGDTSNGLKEYEMNAHVFGAISSPSCANYALKKTANENEEKYGSSAANTLRRNFYVDDMLKSVSSSAEMIDLINRIIGLCDEGGFNLTKFVSTNKEVLNSLPPSKLAPRMKEYDLYEGSTFIERALGVHWCIVNDEMLFRIEFKDSPLTRKGILSTISSIYDPPGLASPFIFEGRKVLQAIVHEKRCWDDDISSTHRMRWEKWRIKLAMIERIRIPRCVKPIGFGHAVSTTLHHFADASEIGYGTASYIRQVNLKGEINVCLLMGKSRVAPMRATNIHRLELTAAFTASKISNLLNSELDISPLLHQYWSDSKIVLGYIKNESKRFRVYVANRTQAIRETTDVSKWHYVNTKDNPADYASRGLDVDSPETQTWFIGPERLWKPDENLIHSEEQYIVEDNDPELKKVLHVNTVSLTNMDNDIFSRLESRISGWYRCIRVLATIRRFITLCKQKINMEVGTISAHLTVEDLNESEKCLIRMIQKKYFHHELRLLKSIKIETGRAGEKKRKAALKKSSSLRKLNPFVDEFGIIRVGGRIQKSLLEDSLKYPVILPRKGHFTTAAVRWIHQKVEHAGRYMTLHEMRTEGYWVINGSSIIRSLISRCVRCRFLRGRLGEQKMSDLPHERINESPPFTFSGVDMFGPFIIKERRSEVKRYVVLFTCFSSRAVHLETTVTMETDSLINAMRRFIGRRGSIRSLQSDNGGNFVGADNELKRALSELDHEKIRGFLQNEGADWIEWKFNPPTASHMGGVWERQIRSARNILSSLMKEHGHILNDESFRTLIVEAESIINSRPLTVDYLSDPNAPIPLSPSNILTCKSKVTHGPPGVFQKADLYCRRRWRRVQHLANVFWRRWRQEFLMSLQNRVKWTNEKRNFAVGDIVLVKDSDARRNQWPMARVIEVHPSDDGLVRSVKVKMASKNNEQGSSLDRPISKLVLLLESEES